MRTTIVACLALTFWFCGCGSSGHQGPTPANPNASAEARKTLRLLHDLVGDGRILLGHQDPTAYGVGWKPAPGDAIPSIEERGDIVQVTGDHPAVHGWGVDDPEYEEQNIDGISWDLMRELIVSGHQRGGLQVFSWHPRNPVTETDAWDTSIRVVADLLPGGNLNSWLNDRLDGIANYFSSLQSGEGDNVQPIPVVFRPYHEMNGSWFWWGRDHATTQEYIELYRYTFDYLTKARNQNQILWAYSPDRFDSLTEFLERYPGDDYVDILGLDNYYDFYGEGRSPQMFTEQLRILTTLAQQRGKVAAVTETGLESIPNSNWFTQVLAPALFADSVSSRVAYLMLWRNDRKEHHYAPFPGHPSVPDFVDFVADPRIMLESDLASYSQRSAQ